MKHQDSLFIKTCKGERCERAPLWLMRQAGRYLPEYLKIRKAHSMLEVIRTPELATEVTLQPIRRFGFDASIVFTDILTPLIGMGFVVEFLDGAGPTIFNPIVEPNDVDRLTPTTSEENVPFTLTTIKELNRQLNVPLIGFSGAPFTLSSYAVKRPEPGSLRGVLRFMRQEQKAWHKLQQKLSVMISEYLVAQANAGASALMLFDSWAGVLTPVEYETLAKPYLKEICAHVRSKVGDLPLIYFGPQTAGLYPQISELQTDVIGLDWRTSLQDGANRIGRKCTVQGNLDPELLTCNWAACEPHVKRILEESKNLTVPHVFNLGHGILPDTPVENVEKLVATVQSFRY